MSFLFRIHRQKADYPLDCRQASSAGGIRFFGLNGQMAGKNPMEFLSEVRAEANKVTWPSRKETMITTAMVFLMVVVASIFFLVVDQAIRFVLGILLG